MVLEPPAIPLPEHPTDRIAFAGAMCSGKTKYATTLVTNYGYSKLSFAQLLKETAAKLYGPIEKNNAGRKLLQQFADDLKKWDKDLFTTHVLLTLEDYYRGGTRKFVLDDMRFVSEEKALRASGFKIVVINCDDEIRKVRINMLYPDTDPARFDHPSEQEWKKITPDLVLENSHSFQFTPNIGKLLDRSFYVGPKEAAKVLS